MTFFTFSWTILLLLYIFVTPLWYPQAYLYWAHLGFEITTVIFWLVTFALLAQEAAAFDVISGAENDINQGLSDTGVQIIWPNWKAAINSTKAAAGLGALTWLLFIITLIVFGVFLHKHRVANGSTGFGTGHSKTSADVEASAATPEKFSSSTQPPVELNDVDGTQHQVSSTAFA